MKKTTPKTETKKLAMDALTLVKGGRSAPSRLLGVVTDGVEWTRTGYGEDPIKGHRDCD